MKTFHKIIIGAVGLAGTLSSCSDYLEVEPRNLVILEQFWNEKTDVDNCVAGCYEGLQSFDCMARMIAWGEFRSDNVVAAQKAKDDDLHMYRLLTENIDPSNVYTNWSSLYTVINRCNTVMLYAPDVQKKDPSFSESDLKAIIGEVTAIRDLCYFYLIRTFRDVPYITEAYTDDDQPMDIGSTPFNEILDKLINDLETVKGDVVTTYPTQIGAVNLYQYGRITKTAIWAMLCDMYLWKQDYTKCIEYADTIIGTKRKQAQEAQGIIYNNMTKYFDNYPLINNYISTNDLGYPYFGNAYRQTFGSFVSDEILFELYFTQNDNQLANGAVSTYYGNPDNGWYFRVSPSTYVASDVSNKTYKLFVNDKDARNYENMLSSSQIAKYVLHTHQTQVPTTGSPTSFGLGSWSKDKNHSSWILYRLTDIMLMKAEALTKQATSDTDPKLTEAYEIARVINKRSLLINPDNITPTSTYLLKMPTTDQKNAVENLVFQERQRELMFEGKRWYDLVRRSMRDGNTNYLTQQMANKGLQNSAVVNSRLQKMEAMFLPCNLEECKVNKNLWKNPSYTFDTSVK